MINSNWSFIAKGITVVFNSGGKIRIYFRFLKKISPKFVLWKGNLPTYYPEIEVLRLPLKIVVQQSVSKYFVLAFGAKDPQGQRVEIRNERLELIGNCRIDDLQQLQQFIGDAKHQTALMQLLPTLPLGRITPIML